MRHLKGEDDKPLPPTKPRKQYKMAKELRGDDGTTEKLKKAKQSEDRQADQVCRARWGCFYSSMPALAVTVDSCLEHQGPAARAGACEL